MNSEPLKLFYSYSHKDQDLRDMLSSHLANLVSNGVIEEWYDGNITGGAEWNREIDEHIRSADLILLLISSNFMKSNFCYHLEAPIAFEQQMKNKARVVPIILSPVELADNEEILKWQVLPQLNKPVRSSAWKSEDEAFVEVVKGLKKVIQERRTGEPPKTLVTMSNLLATRKKSLLFKLVEGGKKIIRWGQKTDSDQAAPDAILRLPEAEKKCMIPDELPFYCNRLDQDQKLDVALRRQTNRSHPFVCIIHGDPQECPEKYRERVIKSTLLKALSLDKMKHFVDSYYLELPRDPSDPDFALEVMRSNLGEHFGGRSATLETIATHIGLKPLPIFIYSSLSSGNKKFESLVNFFVRFWSEFPAIYREPMEATSNHRLIACLLVEHQESIASQRKQENASFLMQLFAPTSATGLAGKAAGIVLPELSPVELFDVKTWLDEGKDFRGICQNHAPNFCNPDAAFQKIEAKYKESGPVISMRQLADDLKEVLCQTCC